MGKWEWFGGYLYGSETFLVYLFIWFDFLNCTHVQHIQNITSKRMNKKQTLKLNIYEQKQVNLTICQIANHTEERNSQTS